MGVFVKNVENVQGDERDIIIFSSTFGRNKQGSFIRNFGVLGQKGGERRLNVAVTRSRKKVIMVTSMPIAEISDLLTTRHPPSTPRDFLQGYMEYARAISAGELSFANTLLSRMTVLRETSTSALMKRADDGFYHSVGEYAYSTSIPPPIPVQTRPAIPVENRHPVHWKPYHLSQSKVGHSFQSKPVTRAG